MTTDTHTRKHTAIENFNLLLHPLFRCFKKKISKKNKLVCVNDINVSQILFNLK